MNYLIFDMDGVLLDARGYHKALQRTVNLIAEKTLSIPGLELSRDDIHQFEALGISSEWHSSALCLSFLEVQKLSESRSPSLNLTPLFEALKDQSLSLPARERCLKSIDQICSDKGVNFQSVRYWIDDSEDIQKSGTMKHFQEFVLGSEVFQKQYGKKACHSVSSYLAEYDLPLISKENGIRTLSPKNEGKFACSVMTNRPSSGPSGFHGSPEAEIGLELVELVGMPVIGYGEIKWLADQSGLESSNLAKPNPAHALAAIFISAGFDKETSLLNSLDHSNWADQQLTQLEGAEIMVFEDTPAGIRAVKDAAALFKQAGVEVTIQAFGITSNPVKKSSLEAEGAVIFENINHALESLDHF